jgi:hypothetical protein
MQPPAMYRTDLPQPVLDPPGAGGCAEYALSGVAEALDQETKADQNGGYERGLRAHCLLRSVRQITADLVLAPSIGVGDGLARATVVLIERCRAVLTERCRRINR